MLAKIRHYVTPESLRSIYFAIFSSLMTYGAHVWAQKCTQNIKRVMKLQDKSLRIINFASYHEPTSQLYAKSKILKFGDQIRLNNFFHVYDSINRILPPSLQDLFVYQQRIHLHDTRTSAQSCVKLPKTHTISFGINSITGQAARAWNHFHMSSAKNLNILSRSVCKTTLTANILDSY